MIYSWFVVSSMVVHWGLSGEGSSVFVWGSLVVRLR